LKVRSLVELEEEWSVEDVERMHELLDGLDWAESEGVRRAQKAANEPRK